MGRENTAIATADHPATGFAFATSWRREGVRWRHLSVTAESPLRVGQCKTPTPLCISGKSLAAQLTGNSGERSARVITKGTPRQQDGQ